MKLFQRLLVAPAALGLLTPISVNANEVNLNEISNYSDVENIDFANSFNNDVRTENPLLAGGEGLLDSTTESFSSTTTASFGSNFYVGTVDNSALETTTFSYDFSMGLSTSFTGEDSFDVAIIGGNVTVTDEDASPATEATPVDAAMGGDGTGDALVLDGISYTFPLGGFTVLVGDGTGVDDLNTGACSYSAFTDGAGDCGTPSIGGSADSAVAASYDFGNGYTVAGGLGFGTSDVGVLSDEDASTVGLELAYTADTYAVAIAYTDDDALGDPADTSYYSIQGTFTPDAAYTISAGYEFDDDDADSMFLGFTTEAGPGSLSLAVLTQGLDTDHDDGYAYEAAYAYDVNDGMTITPGVFIVESASDDEFGAVVKTSFSF